MLIGDIFLILIVLFFAWLLFKVVKRIAILVANSVLGLLILFVLNLLGFGIEINWLSLLLVGIGGFLGLIAVIILHFLGVL